MSPLTLCLLFFLNEVWHTYRNVQPIRRWFLQLFLAQCSNYFIPFNQYLNCWACFEFQQETENYFLLLVGYSQQGQVVLQQQPMTVSWNKPQWKWSHLLPLSKDVWKECLLWEKAVLEHIPLASMTLLVSVCEILSPQDHLEDHLFNASMLFKDFQYLSATCKQGLWSPRSGFKLPGNSLVFTISPLPHNAFWPVWTAVWPLSPTPHKALVFSNFAHALLFSWTTLLSPTLHTLLYISNPNLFFKAYLKCHFLHKIIHDGQRWR